MQYIGIEVCDGYRFTQYTVEGVNTFNTFGYGLVCSQIERDMYMSEYVEQTNPYPSGYGLVSSQMEL